MVTVKNIIFSKELLETRMYVVDWLLKIKYLAKLMDETFFISISILGKVLIKLIDVLIEEDLYLIGYVSLFISCKYFEEQYLSLKFLKNYQINKFTKKDILASELEILKILKFKIPKNNLFECLQKKKLEIQ